ncbi:MAG: hypothetical protein J6K72_04660 [Clostridia bacterium]|nr:hypothetical protein [Clostridia bacterium]
MKIDLANEEALVLFDWLYQNSENEKYSVDDAVKCVFWSMKCLLERELVEPCYENYAEIITKAKETVKKKYGV